MDADTCTERKYSVNADFYKRYGYQEFGILADYPPGHQRYFLKKQLEE